MGEPEGRQEQSGQSERGSVPEGVSGSDPAFGDGVSALRGRIESAKDLDMLAAMDEVESLVQSLIKVANEAIRVGPRNKPWEILLAHLQLADKDLEQANTLQAR